jgi:uncharacterized membrane protein YgcG
MPVLSDPPGTKAPPQTLATANMPRRVRRVLEHLLSMMSDELARLLGQMLNDFEQQLFRLADHARNPGLQSGHMETLRTMRLNRADLVPRYLVGLEAALAGIREPARPAAAASASSAPIPFRTLSLVDDEAMDEDSVLRDIALRHESRASLPLHLLGQRFGVLSGSPAFDAERLPVGPQTLCRILREASQSLQINMEARLLLFRTFDRAVMQHYTKLAETVNALLERDGVLPSLAYVPIRLRPTAQNQDPSARRRPEDAPEPSPPPQATYAPLPPSDYGRGAGDGESRGRGGGGSGGRSGGGGGSAPREPARPHTAWLGEPEHDAGGIDESAAFALLQQLLSGRRDLLGKLRPDAGGSRLRMQLDTGDILQALDGLQAAASPTGSTRSVQDIKQALLAQSRQLHGKGAALAREDSDAFELLGMLYTQIEREMRRDTPAVGLLNRLQIPLLRVALQDRAFFVRPQHPARQLLNAVAESGANWLGDDELDPQLVGPLRQAVEYVVSHYRDDPAVFETAHRDLQGHLQQTARKAELTERRHVEAARGKEKLEMAKRRAVEVIEAAVRDKRLPKFVRALLNQAWADVLTLTLLRHGEESDEWRRQLDATHQIVTATGRGGAAVPGLSEQIEGALGQVGYHAEEAVAIARRLTTGLAEEEDDPASRTELAMRLKARARLGEDTEAPKPKLPPRTAEEQAAYDQLRTLPFGTWFDFVSNQQGDCVRRRLSWYSPLTDNALFVNQRGQRIGEQSLDSLARMVSRGQARVVTADRGRLVDRAWHGALSALRSFAGNGAGATEEPA